MVPAPLGQVAAVVVEGWCEGAGIHADNVSLCLTADALDQGLVTSRRHDYVHIRGMIN